MNKTVAGTEAHSMGIPKPSFWTRAKSRALYKAQQKPEVRWERHRGAIKI